MGESSFLAGRAINFRFVSWNNNCLSLYLDAVTIINPSLSRSRPCHPKTGRREGVIFWLIYLDLSSKAPRDFFFLDFFLFNDG